MIDASKSPPRRRVVEVHRFLGISHAYADLKLECGHFVPGTQRQSIAKMVGCRKCQLRDANKLSPLNGQGL